MRVIMSHLPLVSTGTTETLYYIVKKYVVMYLTGHHSVIFKHKYYKDSH